MVDGGQDILKIGTLWQIVPQAKDILEMVCKVGLSHLSLLPEAGHKTFMWERPS